MSPNKSDMSWYAKAVKFLSEVKKEVSQVVWPARKEASVSTVIVCALACIMAVYLFAVDRSLLFLVQLIIG
jgi:preprotein translocase subunit SecE